MARPITVCTGAWGLNGHLGISGFVGKKYLSSLVRPVKLDPLCAEEERRMVRMDNHQA